MLLRNKEILVQPFCQFPGIIQSNHCTWRNSRQLRQMEVNATLSVFWFIVIEVWGLSVRYPEGFQWMYAHYNITFFCIILCHMWGTRKWREHLWFYREKVMTNDMMTMYTCIIQESTLVAGLQGTNLVLAWIGCLKLGKAELDFILGRWLGWSVAPIRPPNLGSDQFQSGLPDLGSDQFQICLPVMCSVQFQSQLP